MHTFRSLALGVLTLVCAATWGAATGAHLIYYPHKRGFAVDPHSPITGPAAAPYIDGRRGSKSGTWADVQASLPFVDGPDTALLLTDGTVVIHDFCTASWYRLTPDSKGKYETGNWSALAPMPSGYYPFFYASQILPDGRMIMNGGEYNKAEGACGKGAWTKKGALYDPVTDTWTSIPAPHGWSTIGDAQSAVLPDGTYMLADCCIRFEALANVSGTTVTWTATGSGKVDDNDEEGWTILPDGNLLTVDTWNGIDNPVSSTEIYTTSTGTWSHGRKTASQLVDSYSHEIGPAVLLPSGFVIYFGGDTATGSNNLFNTMTGKWSAAPSFPVLHGQQYDCTDAPAALLPDGSAIVQASPNLYKKPSHFFEFSIGKKTGNGHLIQVSDPPSAPYVSSFEGRFLELPTGQVLWNNDGQTGHAEVATYTPTGKPDPAWLPVISSVAATLVIGSTGNPVAGTNFNGFSQGASYGDDAQEATNYPLVRITNASTGDVCFGRSHDFSTMGVWTAGSTNAQFDVPAICETGAATLQVIVNGLASAGVSVTLSN